jgi:hypothetical protein
VVAVPGEHLVFDRATEAGWEVFCAVLAWSRYRFIRFATDQKRQTTLALLAECFEELGGVPAVVLTDSDGLLAGLHGGQCSGAAPGVRAVLRSVWVPSGFL